MSSPAKPRSPKNRRSGNTSVRETAAAASGINPRLRTALIWAGLIVLMLIAYGNSIGNGFVWDDHQQVVQNPNLKAGIPLSHLFAADTRFVAHSQSVQNTDYRPLQMLTYRLLLIAFGADAEAFHLCSLFFAIACVLAAFSVFEELTRRWTTALAAAALFALYPIHTEAIDWIAALPELGFTLFLLLAFVFFLRSRGDTSEASTSWPDKEALLPAAVSWLLYAIALLWKETAIVFPLMVAGYVVLVEQRQRPGKRLLNSLVASLPYWIVLAAYLVLRAVVLGTLGTAPRDWVLTPLQLLLNMLRLMEMYWGKLALPVWLDAYYTFSPVRSPADPRALLALLPAMSLGALGIVLLLRHRKTGALEITEKIGSTVLFAILWVSVALLPAMNIGALGRNPFTERYLYLPSVGFCLLIVLAAQWALKRLPAQVARVAGLSVLVLVLLGFLTETIARNPVWKDDATLFSAALILSPDAPFLHNMVAEEERDASSQTDDVEQHYQKAATLAEQQNPPDRPDAVTAYRGLAWIYADRAQFQQALQELTKAAAISPEDADTNGEKGLILARAGDGMSAEPLLEHALATEPDNENVLSALGLIARENLHDPVKAADYFQRALTAHGTEDAFAASQHNNLGTTFGDANNYKVAIEQFREAVRILPTDPEFHINLASSLAAEGQMAEARNEAEAALQIAPNDPAARAVLQQIMEQPGAVK